MSHYPYNLIHWGGNDMCLQTLPGGFLKYPTFKSDILLTAPQSNFFLLMNLDKKKETKKPQYHTKKQKLAVRRLSKAEKTKESPGELSPLSPRWVPDLK